MLFLLSIKCIFFFLNNGGSNPLQEKRCSFFLIFPDSPIGEDGLWVGTGYLVIGGKKLQSCVPLGLSLYWPSWAGAPLCSSA